MRPTIFESVGIFGPKPYVFSVAVEKLKNYNLQDYNFVCGSVWV
jgi:hypothetical protein